MATDYPPAPDFIAADYAVYERAFAQLRDDVRRLLARARQPDISKEIKALVLRAQKLLDTTPEPSAGNFPDTLELMQQMVDAAAREAATPRPRVQDALPFAAMGLVRIKHDYGAVPPRLSDTRQATEELAALLEGRGSYSPSYSLVALRKALKVALVEFNYGRPHTRK